MNYPNISHVALIRKIRAYGNGCKYGNNPNLCLVFKVMLF